MIEEGVEVYPGRLLMANTQELLPGDGTYVYLGKIYAQVAGQVKILARKTWHNQDDQDKITVQKTSTESDAAEQGEEEDPGSKQPLTGDVVHARVTKVEDRFAKVDILAVADAPLNAVFVGIIQQRDVRDFDRDPGPQMHHSFRPGDIIKARVTQGVEAGGTSRDASVLLSTAEEELGVVFARSQHTGSLMVPRSWGEFECIQTRTKEKRKVAKVIS